MLEQLATEFEARLRDANRQCIPLGYDPHRFTKMLDDSDGRTLAKKLVISGELQDGLKRLAKLDRLDLSMEWIMLEQKFAPLFTEDELKAARWHLGQVKPDIALPDNAPVAAPVADGRLETIRTIDALTNSFNTFQRDAREHPGRAKSILTQTTYFVRDNNSGAFGPGKFVGFRGMNFLAYDAAKNDPAAQAWFQGGFSRKAIEKVVGSKFQPDSTFHAECQKWGETLLGLGAFGNADPSRWKFVTVALPGREATSIFPDEVTQPEKYPEGAWKTVTINAYERNRKARDKCIAHYGASCQVCGLSFQDRYQGLGDGFIHVHHIKLLSQIGKEYDVDPIRDLRPVCPNCHAMLHSPKGPPLTIDELKNRLR